MRGREPLSHPLRVLHNHTVCLVLKETITLKLEEIINQTKVPGALGRFDRPGTGPLSSLDESPAHLSGARWPQDTPEAPRAVSC